MAIGFVQDDVTVASASASTIARAFGSNVTAGNLIWVGVTWSDADATPTVTDSLGNTYVEIGTHFHTGSGGGAGMACFYAKNITGGACTVTADYGGNRSFREIFVAEFSGCDTTAPLDTSTFTEEGTATTATDDAATPAASVAVNNSLLLGFISSVSGMGTAAAGTSYTELIDTTGGGGGFAQYEVRLLAVAASTPATWTVSVSGAGLYNARLMVFKPAAAGAFTLVADPGSYSVTGTAMTPKAGRKIIAAGGTYSVSGTAATLRAARKILAAGGTYSVSGTAATLRADRIFHVDAGSYAVTGTAADLVHAVAGQFVLSAESGSYAISGSAAGLLADRVLSAEGGSYAVVGSDANLTVTPAGGGAASYWSYNRKRRR